MPAVSTFQELFQDQLRDVYDAEKQILEALPKLIEAVQNAAKMLQEPGR